MRRECRERFPRHRHQRKPLVSDPGMHYGTCVTHVPWCMSGSLTRGGKENVPGIPGACATRNFTYLVRGSCPVSVYLDGVRVLVPVEVEKHMLQYLDRGQPSEVLCVEKTGGSHRQRVHKKVMSLPCQVLRRQEPEPEEDHTVGQQVVKLQEEKCRPKYIHGAFSCSGIKQRRPN